MLPNIPRNPRCSLIDSNRQISTSFGAFRYQSPKTSTIVLTKALRLSIAVVSPIQRYSLVRSVRIPHARFCEMQLPFEGNINQEHQEHLFFI